jgi:undecaprenyl-diphosphatase
MSAEGPALERWSPVDALRIVVAAVGLLVTILLDRLVGEQLLDFVSDVLAGFQSIDATVVTVFAAVIRVATLAFLVVGFVIAVARGRWPFLATVGLGVGLGIVFALVANALLDTSLTAVLVSDDVLSVVGEEEFPTAAGLAAVTGVVAAGVPWFERRWRRLGWLLVLALATVHGLTSPLSFETLAAVFSGALGGALADSLLGVPTRRPTQEEVTAGLDRAGVVLADLRPASVDARGSTPYFGSTTDGTPLFVKALGADERKADVLFRLVRSLTPRDLGDEKPFSSLRRAVEHEALVALAAAQVGVRTPPFVALASAEPGAFVLAYEAVDGRSLDGVDDDQITDDVLEAIWAQMGILRAHGIAHRDLRLANVFLAADGEVWFIDFGFSELAASDLLLATDLAELVLSLSLKVGPERAVAHARDGVGAEALAGAAHRFAPGYLSGATRGALKQQPELLAEVRARIADTADR